MNAAAWQDPRTDGTPAVVDAGAGAARRIVIAGASGLVGTALGTCLARRGHRIDPLVRRPPRPGTTEIRWDPAGGEIDAAGMEGVDAVVNLAGENIAAGRWTTERKERIRTSRIEGTRLLCEALAGMARRPAVLISASALGYYGDRGDTPVTEESTAGAGFLADVCREWEAATDPARQAGIRVVNLRIGIVLSTAGGALARMLPAFRRGFGGRIGGGRQYMSWISLDDLVAIIEYLLVAEGLSGPVNAVAPTPVTNAEFTRTLGRVLRRPTWMHIPGLVVRLGFGELGETLLLSGARVQPVRLLAAGFRFGDPDLEPALRRILGRPPGG